MHRYLFEIIQIDNYLESFQSICFFQTITNSISLFCDKIIKQSRIEEWRLNQFLMESLHSNDNISSKDLLKIEFKDREHSPIIIRSPELNPFKLFKIRYNVPWPINQILTDQNQNRYSNIFSFLANLYLTRKCLNEKRLDREVCQARLYALNFVNSLSSYAIHNVIVPIIGSTKWKEHRTIDAIILAHETMLNTIESKLFFKVLFTCVISYSLSRWLPLEKELKKCL